MGRILDYCAAQGFVVPATHKRKMGEFDRQFDELESLVQQLKAQLQNQQAQTGPLQREIQRLQDEDQKRKTRVDANDNPKGYRCDHCGSPELGRTGSRPNATFGIVGTKDSLFECRRCGKESAFIQG